MEISSDKLMKEFLRGLRIALANGATYSEGHAVFLKSIQEFKEKADKVFASLRYVDILISPRYLIVNEKKLEKDPLYEELARLLHYRNIKGIKIEQSVAIEELRTFLYHTSRRPKELIKEGGVGAILKTKGLTHVSVEMLDYSAILKSTQEDKDIWAYLLQKAVEGENVQEVEVILDNFNRMVRQLGVKDFLGNEDLQTKIVNFLIFLQGKKDDTFYRCHKDLLQGLLSDRKAFDVGTVRLPEQLKESLRVLNEIQLAEILFEETLRDPKEAPLVISLYSQFATIENHKKIIGSFLERIENSASPHTSREWLTSVVDQFASVKEEEVRAVYQQMAQAGLEKIAWDKIYRFDGASLPQHYRATLLNLLFLENDPQRLALVVEKIVHEWGKIEKEKKISFFRSLLEIADQRAKSETTLQPCLERLYGMVGNYVEPLILEGAPSVDFEYFINTLKQSALGPQGYLQKLFQENKVNPVLLKAFFKFFSSEIQLLNDRLKKKLQDIHFVLCFIDNIRGISPGVAIEVLKNVYSCHNLYVKRESIKIMGTFSTCDEDFLLTVLRQESGFGIVKEEAAAILLRDPQLRRQVAQILFDDQVISGKQPILLIENIRVAGSAGLAEAKEYLLPLSQKNFFWHKEIKQEALAALEKIAHGKD